LAATNRDLAAALGPSCETVVLAAARCQGVMLAGAYPELAFRGEVPRLLGRHNHAGGLSAPAITARSTDWEPIGLGAIQDLVQDAFGPPVDFDRSRVALPPSDTPYAGCPACEGGRFGFPGELAEAQAAMCQSHRAEANDVTASRIARAPREQPRGVARNRPGLGANQRRFPSLPAALCRSGAKLPRAATIRVCAAAAASTSTAAGSSRHSGVP
jgi:hypothetical protein